MKYLVILLLMLDLETSAQQRSFALVVGISEYQNPDIPKLNFSHRDAAFFSDYLQTRPANPLSHNQVLTLLNKEASIAAIYEGLDWLKESCKEGDTAYIYFSGHGDLEVKPGHSLGYLLAYNSPANNYRNNAIRLEDINNIANTLSTKNKSAVVIVTDACHSGKLAGDFYKGKQFVASELKRILNNEVRLTACAADEEAAEGIFWGDGRGVFSYYLISGLNGKADNSNNGVIDLSELTRYIQSSIKLDKYLIQQKHKQNPVIDGNPQFLMSAASLAPKKENTSTTSTSDLPALLAQFKNADRDPIDYFFAQTRSRAPDQIFHFEDYKNIDPTLWYTKILDDALAYQDSLQAKLETNTDPDKYDDGYFLYVVTDTINLLKQQLKNNPQLQKRFNEKMIQLAHDKTQEMVNAYLGGDILELEKRQYYYTGNRNYSSTLNMLAAIISITPESHSLKQILRVQQQYLAGLIARLQMVSNPNNDSLLKIAFAHERKALELEPYAAYIHNELGNLQLHQLNFDSANYHFTIASELAPTWAIPWSNKIRLNNARNDISQADHAFQIADSLQPDLSYVLVNEGLVKEKQKNLLLAETFYNRAISKNNVHFLPFERLAFIHVSTGNYAEADSKFHQAFTRKQDFSLTDNYFRMGVELGGIPPIEGTDVFASKLASLYKSAAILESKKQYLEAISIYEKISLMENQHQLDQAVFKGYKDGQDQASVEDYNLKWEKAVPLGGALKIVRIYELLGKYEMAEATLLKQVTANRKAGDLRQKALDTRVPGAGIYLGPNNFYWLEINAAFEDETRNFYQRMISRFPRDRKWYENGGLFLYKRLLLTYNKLSVDRYRSFFRTYDKHTYPWLGGVAEPEVSIIKYVLPGTGEEISIKHEIYNPVLESLYNLEQAAKFSGDIVPAVHILRALGDLNAWSSNTAKATRYYGLWASKSPGDQAGQKKYLEYLIFTGELSDASKQLDKLAKTNIISRQEILLNADFKSRALESKKAEALLAGFKPKDMDEKNQAMLIYAQLNWLTGNLKKALQYVQDSVKPFRLIPGEDEETARYKSDFNTDRLYTIARLMAFQGQNENAAKILESAFDSGFNYKYVVDNDEAFTALRKDPLWKKLSSKYPHGIEYSEVSEITEDILFFYIVPTAKLPE